MQNTRVIVGYWASCWQTPNHDTCLKWQTYMKARLAITLLVPTLFPSTSFRPLTVYELEVCSIFVYPLKLTRFQCFSDGSRDASFASLTQPKRVCLNWKTRATLRGDAQCVLAYTHIKEPGTLQGPSG